MKFADDTKEAGIVSKPNPSREAGPGTCFLDYDNDGKPDLLTSNNGAQGGMSLYHNLGSGKFEDVTKQAGLDGNLHGVSCTTGDYDNDGFTDLIVGTDAQLLPLHNEKNGTFKNETETAGIKTSQVGGLTLIDYDHDGDLDLYIARRVAAVGGVLYGVNQMWRNNGDRTFTDVSAETGFGGSPDTVSAIGTDYDNESGGRLIDKRLAGIDEKSARRQIYRAKALAPI